MTGGTGTGTPAAAGTFTNSYIDSEADLEAALENDPRTAAIALKAASALVQSWYVAKATANIDRLPFQGFKKTSSQARQFPRKFQLDPEQDNPWGETVTLDSWGYYAQTDVPDEVETACVEEAIALYAFHTDSDRTDRQAQQDDGVKSLSYGGGYSESLGPIQDRGNLQSKDAYLLLEPWIDKAPFTV